MRNERLLCTSKCSFGFFFSRSVWSTEQQRGKISPVSISSNNAVAAQPRRVQPPLRIHSFTILTIIWSSIISVSPLHKATSNALRNKIELKWSSNGCQEQIFRRTVRDFGWSSNESLTCDVEISFASAQVSSPVNGTVGLVINPLRLPLQPIESIVHKSFRFSSFRSSFPFVKLSILNKNVRVNIRSQFECESGEFPTSAFDPNRQLSPLEKCFPERCWVSSKIGVIVEVDTDSYLSAHCSSRVDDQIVHSSSSICVHSSRLKRRSIFMPWKNRVGIKESWNATGKPAPNRPVETGFSPVHYSK